jgi:hypothetical protein
LADSGALVLSDFAVTSLLFELDIFNLNKSPKGDRIEWMDHIFGESEDLDLNPGFVPECWVTLGKLLCLSGLYICKVKQSN